MYLFLLFICKNCNAVAATAGISAVGALLFHVYLAVFAFSITNKGTLAAGISG